MLCGNVNIVYVTLVEAPQLGTGRKGQPSDKQSAPVNANRKGAAARPKQGQRTRGRISKTVMGNSSPENSQLDDGELFYLMLVLVFLHNIHVAMYLYVSQIILFHTSISIIA